ncbi:MAG: flippase, partial [Moraxellaceae bacterium]
MLAEAIAFYALTVCLYSFDTSGVQAIIEARIQGGREAETARFMNILAARMALFSICFIPLTLIFEITGWVDTSLLIVWLAFVLGMILQSNYYFQAIENNVYLAVVVIVSRGIAMLAVYVLVDDESDLLLAAMLISGSFMLSGLAAITKVFRMFGLRSLALINLREIGSLLHAGKHLFLGNISVALFRGANVVILSAVSTEGAVAAYAIAEKVIKSIQALARPLNQVFAPVAIRKWASLDFRDQNKARAFRLIWASTKIQIYSMLLLLPMLVIFIGLAARYDIIVGITREAVVLIALMSPAVIFGVANAMFGVVGLNMIGAQSYFSMTVLIVGVITFIFS